MSSASESCRPASEQFNNTLLPCCTQLRTWEQIYSEVTWGTSFFTNIRLNTNIKLLLKRTERKCHLVHEVFTRRQQLLPLVGQEGLAGLVLSTLRLISQHALLPCHLPAYKEGEIMLSALKPVRALWVKQNNQSIKHFCSILRCFLPAGVGSSSFVLFGLFLFVFSLRKKQTVCLTWLTDKKLQVSQNLLIWFPWNALITELVTFLCPFPASSPPLRQTFTSGEVHQSCTLV